MNKIVMLPNSGELIFMWREKTSSVGSQESRGFQIMFPEPAAAVRMGNLLGRQILGPPLIPAESETLGIGLNTVLKATIQKIEGMLAP